MFSKNGCSVPEFKGGMVIEAATEEPIHPKKKIMTASINLFIQLPPVKSNEKLFIRIYMEEYRFRKRDVLTEPTFI